MIDILTNEAFLTLVAINVIAALGMNLVYITGQLNLGQAGFFAVGAYTAAYSNVRWGVGLVPGLACAAVIGSLVALPVAVGANRVRGIYLIMGTLAAGEVIRIAISNSEAVGGLQGYTGFDGVGLWPVLAISVVALVGTATLLSTTFGLRMRSIFDDEDAAAAAGVRTQLFKITSVMLSAAVVGLAGGLFARYLLFINPRDFGVTLSFEIALFTLIGGVHSQAGAVVGAIFVTSLDEVLRKIDRIDWMPEELHPVGPWHTVVYGGLVVLIMALRPEGLVTRRAALRWTQPLRHVRRRRRSVASGRSSESRGRAAVGDIALTATGVSHRFGAVEALDDVTLHVRSGSILALVGANGAGKSTLIDVVSGRYRTQSGAISLGERGVTHLGAPARTQAGIARTFQSVRVFEHLTVEETLRLGLAARVGRVGPGVDDILDLVGLDDARDRLSTDLTLAARRRLEIGRAYATAPLVLLLDEPSVGMNDVERRELAELIRTIRDDGVAVVLVDHNLDLALGVADHAVVIDFGTVIAEGSPDTIFDLAVVRHAYLGAEFVS